MSSSILFSATLLGVLAVMCTGRSRDHLSSAVRSGVKHAIHNGARGEGPIIRMADIPAKSEEQTTKAPHGQPPGLSDMRVTYKLARSEIHESYIGVTQSIDDLSTVPRSTPHVRCYYRSSSCFASSCESFFMLPPDWCEDFNLPSVPFGCYCWRYEYLAYFCVDWSCVNGHSSDFAMCQFLNVTWPIDPPRRRFSNRTPTIGKVQSVLKLLAEYLPLKTHRDSPLAQNLLSVAQGLPEERNT